MSHLFNPDTLKDEYHEAFSKALESGLFTAEARRHLIASRNTRPDSYIALAALAYEHSYTAFRLGARIYLDALQLK